MPAHDGTGPRGQGPMTGGGRGICVLPESDLTQGFGCGRRFGFARRWRGGRDAVHPAMQRYETAGQDRLTGLERRLAELEARMSCAKASDQG